MTRPALCLHVGQHKTGSSAIQNYLFEHREALPGVQYVYKDRANASLWMLQAFKGDLASLPTYRHKGLSQAHLEQMRARARARLDKALSAVTAPVAVLSAESVNLLAPEEVADLQAFLAPYFSSITVFQYVRPMKSRIESAFQEKLKHRRATLDDPIKLNYFRRARVLEQSFGAGNLRLFKFDSALFPRGDIVCHFLEQLGLPLPPHNRATDANLGLSLPAVQLLYAYRQVQRQRAPGDRARVARLAALDGVPFRLHSSLYRRIIGEAPRGVARFEALAGFSLEEQIERDDAIGVRGEGDLLAVAPTALDWLAQQRGVAPGELGADDPQAIAAAVAALVPADA